jgi:5'-3' exonuclease
MYHDMMQCIHCRSEAQVLMSVHALLVCHGMHNLARSLIWWDAGQRRAIGLQEEETARLAAEEEARKKEEAERRKAEKLARRTEMKRQGLLLTGKAKREAERLAAIREQLLKSAEVNAEGAVQQVSLDTLQRP